MRAFLIDPFARTVAPMEYDGDHRSIYRLIGADLFDAVQVDAHGTTLFVDNEGLFREEQAFFRHAGYPQPLAGRALVLGTDRDGDSVSPRVGLEAVTEAIRWVSPVSLNGRVVWVEV